MLLDEPAQVDVHLLRVLVDKAEPLSLGFLLVRYLGALQDERHVLVTAADLTQQFQTGLGVTLLHMTEPSLMSMHREAGVADDTQHIVVVPLIPLHRLLIVGGQHHLGAAALTLGGGMGIERLGREILRLRQNVVVEIGQHRGVEADVVLDEQNHLHTGLMDVVLNVHAVLQQLDDGEDEVGVAQPAEHVVEDAHVLVLDALGDAVREGGQHHAGHLRGHLLHVTGHGEGIVIGITRHADDEVDVGGLQHLVGLLGRRHLSERGRIAHAQLAVLVEQFLVNAPVILQHEGIIRVSHYQHMEDAPRHQIDERHVLQKEVIELLRYAYITHISSIRYFKAPPGTTTLRIWSP